MLYYRVQPIDIDEESGCLLSLLTVWQYTLMESMQIQAGIEIIERLALASMPALNESEKACLRAVQEACEQVLKRTQPELRGNLNSEKLLDAVSALEPAQFFEWFDGQMPFTPRTVTV